MSRATSRVAQSGGQQRLPDADRTEEDHVLVAFEEAQREELLDPVAIEGDRGVPVKALEGLFFFEASSLQPQRQVLVIAAIDFVLQGEFEELEFTELRLPRVRHPVRERGENSGELQAFHHGLERWVDLHGFPPSVRG